ncbi:MAG: hypothetical protein IPP96_01315 [Chitinophagaceae bacterium]|nr:hypothetical protein [Chitinophagaceae bacterium]
MRILIKPVIIAVILFAASPASAQVPPGAPSPTRVAREANNAQREAGNVAETVQNVNDVINALKDVKKMIDSLVANDKSHTAGEVHLILVGINYADESLVPVEAALKKLEGITDLKKVQKTATVTFEMKSSQVPIDIWKDLPKQVQKPFIVHDKDAYNVVLLYRAPAKAKK